MTRLATLPLVLLIGVLWGANWPAVKFMLTELPPLTIRALAFPIAGLVLALGLIVASMVLISPRRESGRCRITNILQEILLHPRRESFFLCS